MFPSLFCLRHTFRTVPFPVARCPNSPRLDGNLASPLTRLQDSSRYPVLLSFLSHQDPVSEGPVGIRVITLSLTAAMCLCASDSQIVAYSLQRSFHIPQLYFSACLLLPTSSENLVLHSEILEFALTLIHLHGDKPAIFLLAEIRSTKCQFFVQKQQKTVAGRHNTGRQVVVNRKVVMNTGNR
ncbi:hypothetical protein FA15DRAFT_259287 [Coprinopsis marcescibilis]|uniref:Uncharacterized protein n=1 Tax=Coprinopsis marcescibilis TaxID=230819 RepID=A0A5C3L2K6_COPMA|nr:hypothetical protein FA15DRAFT_259287 [Coprinopsis marcescibilis]